ncbi:unnamed protein product [Sphagnum balticum]
MQDYDAAPVYSSRAMLEDHSTIEVILYDPQALNSAVELHQRIQSLGSAASDNDPARIYALLATIWEQPVARFFDPEAPAARGTLVLIAFHEFRSRGKHYGGEEGRH